MSMCKRICWLMTGVRYSTRSNDLSTTAAKVIYVSTILHASPAPIVVPDEPIAELPKPQPYANQDLHEPVAFKNIDAWQRPVLSPYVRWENLTVGPYIAVYHRDGYYLLYDGRASRLRAYLTRSGVGNLGERFEGPSPSMFAASLFADPNGINNQWLGLFVDRGGVYQLGEDGRSLRKLIEQPIDSASFIPPSKDRPPRLWVQNGQQITAFELSARDPDKPLFAGVDSIRSVTLPQINVTELQTLNLGDSPHNSLSIVDRPGADTVVLDIATLTRGYFTRFDQAGGKIASGRIALYHQPSTWRNSDTLVGAVFPPLFMMTAAATELIDQTYLDGGFSTPMPRATKAVMCLAVAMHILVAMVMTVWACRRRRLSRRVTIGWTVASTFLGIGIVLAVIAAYPSIPCERCHGCGLLVRVDQEKCPQCGAPWEPPTRDGCEIFEGEIIKPVRQAAIH